MSDRPDLTAMHRSELEAIVVDNAKLIERYRLGITNIVREMEDEGDRVYLGSTNDAGELRELDEQLTDSLNELALKHMHGRDLYMDLRGLREMQLALIEALQSIASVDDDGWTSDGHERCTEIAARILAKTGGAA